MAPHITKKDKGDEGDNQVKSQKSKVRRGDKERIAMPNAQCPMPNKNKKSHALTTWEFHVLIFIS
jgi:hypothetical protein